MDPRGTHETKAGSSTTRETEEYYPSILRGEAEARQVVHRRDWNSMHEKEGGNQARKRGPLAIQILLTNANEQLWKPPTQAPSKAKGRTLGFTTRGRKTKKQNDSCFHSMQRLYTAERKAF